MSVSTQVKPDHPPHPEHPPHPGKPPEQPPGEIDNTLPTPPGQIDNTLPTPEPPDPIITTGRSAVITIDGTQHQFTQDGGTDLGAYVDPQGRFTQHCIRAVNPALPDFTVFFRPDAAGDREEVVFEFGRCHGNPVSSTLGAYSAVITRDGETLATIEVPKHYYYSRWRWQSAARPVTVTVAELLAAKLVPPYDKSIVSPAGKRAPAQGDAGAPMIYTGPMSFGGIYPQMGATGERNDIGVVTEWQADYIMYEDAQSLGYIMAEAEGCGSVTWHLRDENTGAPFDFVTYPNAGGQYWNSPIIANPQTSQSDVYPDVSHAPDPAYVPALITGDPYLIEELQLFTTMFIVGASVPDFCFGGGLRSFAWNMRNVAHCIGVTPDVVPSWLKPKSYWHDYAAAALAYTLPIGPNAAVGTYQQRFADLSRSLGAAGEVACNMEDYTCAVFCHMVDIGIPGWRELAEWKMQDPIARTNGTSGYNRSLVATYTRSDAEGSPGAPVHADWTTLFAWNVANNHYSDWAGYSGDGTHLSRNINTDFANQTLACINWGFRLGIAGTEPGHTWLSAEMVGKVTNQRWAIS